MSFLVAEDMLGVVSVFGSGRKGPCSVGWELVYHVPWGKFSRAGAAVGGLVEVGDEGDDD